VARFPTPHRAQRIAYEEAGAGWIEGEPGAGPQPVYGPGFPCFLFLPLGSEDSGSPRSRKISRPTVMWDPAEVVGGVSPTASNELWIEAPELAAVVGGPAARWQIEGDPQPFGPPGAKLVGVQATLKQVKD
jgi:hypothetical protein